MSHGPIPMGQKIHELIEGIVSKEHAEGIPGGAAAEELIARISSSISKQLTPERLKQLKALDISLETAVATLARKVLEAVIAAGKAAEKAADKL